jgi:pyruvate/2-oxoglutarate dehydrogenase complex dihydrolipoamide dehydrogenase (E3) component
VRTVAGERTLEGSDVLVATGRVPNTQGIGLDKGGIELDARGFVKVDERLETTSPGVWAMGDCAGSPLFTHIAFDDFRVVRDNVLDGGRRTTRDRLVPSCVFIDPELAHVGLTETEARRRGIDVRVAKLPMTANLRAITLGETRGFMKAIVDGASDRILGFTMLGPEAGEVLAVVETAMIARLPCTALREGIITHPTMAEGLGPLFSRLPAARRAEVAAA